MQHVLIWSGVLATTLLTLAIAVAQAARWPRAQGTALITIVGLLIALACVPLGLLICVAYFAAPVSPWLVALPAVPVLLGGAALLALGRGSASPGLAPRAAGWSRGRLAALLSAVLLLLGVSARNALLSSQQRLDARRADLLGLEQIFWPGVPQALNAAPLYAQAYRELVPLDGVVGAHTAFDALWDAPAPTPAQIGAPALAEWVHKNEGAIALAAEGAAMPGHASLEEALWRSDPFGAGRRGKVFKLEMHRKGHDPSSVDNTVSRRRVGDLLATRSLQRASAGQLAAAVQDANTLLALTEQTHSPQLRPERLLERLLATPGLTQEALVGLRFPRGDGLLLRLQRTLVREEHRALDSLALFTTGDTGVKSPDPIDRPFLLGLGWLRADAWGADTERAFDELWETLYAPPAERTARLREVKPEAPENALGGAYRREWIVAALEDGVRSEAVRACAEVGVAVARYRFAHGEWPRTLEALVPGQLALLPADPFDGAPLRYRVDAAAVRVYSVGPDLRDDGGAPIRADAEHAMGDVVFTVAAPARGP